MSRFRESKELRASTDVASWLAAGLVLARVPTDDEALVASAILACANELPSMPPPGLVADVAVLLTGARLPMLAPVTGDETLRAAIHAYDDDVLARLVTTARFDDVLAAFAHLAPTERPAAIALVVGALVERSGFQGMSISPATLRRALARPRAERDATGRGELLLPATAARFADSYLRLARGARQSRALVDDREVFAIDHLAVLRDFGGRMTADHIAAAAEAVAMKLPRRLPSKRDQRGAKDTRMSDDALYPAGGFSSITPGGASSGNIENLVTSELVYMDPGEIVDLFSLRYMEGELLFYTRDDSVFRRHRHLIAIALGPDLDDARVKDRGLPWQRLILALGFLVASIRWLTDALGDDALVIHIAFPPKLLGEEREILALLLEGEIARGQVVIVEQPWGEAIALAAGASGAIADAVIVSLGATPPLPKGLRALHINLAEAAPTVCELAPRPATAPDATGSDPFNEWCDGAEDLLRWLV
ncbi:MAG: hypothetical protein NT062_04145 [Proteobacteria bacterium]|nr:hypothetical protein [Pseudomonadota bacterium]